MKEKLSGKEKHMKFSKLLLSAALCTLAFAGCSSSSDTNAEDSTASDESVKITLAAAASLETVMEEQIIPAFEEEYNVEVEGVYDASGKLVTQIENGLAADVFISAGVAQMTTLVDEGYVEENNVVDLLENKVVLIVPADDDTVTGWDDLTSLDTIAIGDPDSVPAGQYAKEALTNMGIYDEILPKASLGSNVTEVLSWVANKSAQAGIVYATDAAQSSDVKIVATVEDGMLETPVIYPAAALEDSAHKEAAQNFIDFLKKDPAKGYLEEAGFIILD
jgi:molybdate transport system substrate-binding protein